MVLKYALLSSLNEAQESGCANKHASLALNDLIQRRSGEGEADVGHTRS
jgi:hypothetical protein